MRHAVGRQRTAGTTGANSETTGVPTAAARCAAPVLPTTTADAPASTPDSCARSVRPPRSVPAAPGHAAVRPRSSGAAGHHDPPPRVGQQRDGAHRVPNGPAPRRDGGPRVHDDVGTVGHEARGVRGRADREALVVGGGVARGRRDGEHALRLGDVLGQVLAGTQAVVEQRPGIVDGGAGDPRDPRQPERQRGRQRGLVERRQHHRLVEPPRADPGHEPVEAAAAERRADRRAPTGPPRSARRPPRAAAAPRPFAAGPQSIVTSARTATARTAGPASSTSPAPSRRTTSARRQRRPPSTAGGSRPRRASERRTTGAARISSGRVTRGRDEHAGRPRGQRGLDVGCRCRRRRRAGPGRAPSARRASSSMPGRGLRHAAPVVGGVRAGLPDVERSEQAVDLGVDGLGGGAVRMPRRCPDWLVTTPTVSAGAQPRAPGGGGHGTHQTGRRSRARRRRACRRGRTGRPQAAASQMPEIDGIVLLTSPSELLLTVSEYYSVLQAASCVRGCGWSSAVDTRWRPARVASPSC